MTDIAALYPPAPAAVPSDLTRPDRAYRGSVTAMIGGLFLFLVLYLVVIAIAGLVAFWLLSLPAPEVRGRTDYPFLIFKYGGAAAAALVQLFLVKGLFKGRRVEWSTLVGLREADQPELFAFIRKVSEDTGAPFPAGVYVSPDVNAAVLYDSSVLNVVVRPRNDLVIGLGLVNVVNLVELKAVLAHELGHFSQRSAGLGSYLFVADRAVQDVIYRRDAFDRFVDRWGRVTWGVAFPAWVLTGMLRGVRWVLSTAYRGLTPLRLSFGRQMELNADNVAVSVTGSDAPIHVLTRTRFATECLADAAQSLDAAAVHGLFTDDLFYHQSRAAERLRK